MTIRRMSGQRTCGQRGEAATASVNDDADEIRHVDVGPDVKLEHGADDPVLACIALVAKVQPRLARQKQLPQTVTTGPEIRERNYLRRRRDARDASTRRHRCGQAPPER